MSAQVADFAAARRQAVAKRVSAESLAMHAHALGPLILDGLEKIGCNRGLIGLMETALADYAAARKWEAPND